LKPVHDHTSAFCSRHLLLWVAMVVLLVVSTSSFAQNTKGDDPATKTSRETRFKSKPKKKEAKPKNKRITPAGRTQSTSAARGPSEKERAWTGDITGRKVPAARSSKAAQKNQNVYQPSGRRTSSGPSPSDDARSADGGKPPKRIQARSSSSQARNVYPRKGPYARTPQQPSSGDRPYKTQAGASAQPKVRSSSDRARNVYPTRGPYVAKTTIPSRDDSPRNWKSSAPTRPLARTSTGKTSNVYPKRGPYVAKTQPPARGDQPMRWTGSTVNKPKVRSASGSARNTFSARGPFVSNASPQPRMRENPPGKKRQRKEALSASKPYIRGTSINPNAGFWNIRRKGEQAHIGDIAGKPLRSRNYQSPTQGIQGKAGSAYDIYRKSRKSGDVAIGKTKGGYETATKGPTAWQGDISGRNVRYRNFSSKGKVAAGQPLSVGRKSDTRATEKYTAPNKMFMRGAVSASGQSWNNDGKPLTGRSPEKARSSAKYVPANKMFMRGAVSASGRSWNNDGKPLTGRSPEKARSSAKYVPANKMFMRGAVSASGRSWNNDGKPVSGRTPGKLSVEGKYMPPNKMYMRGPMSASDRSWNNDGKPVTGKGPGKAAFAYGSFQGNVKTRKPEKGGGSVSGQLWNNSGNPIAVRTPGRTQGENYSGNIRRTNLRNDYIRNPNSARAALLKVRPGKSTFMYEFDPVRVKQPAYADKKHAPKSVMPGITPGKSTTQASMAVRGARMDWRYIQNKSASDKALKVKEPGKEVDEYSTYSKGMKQNWKYIHNPSAADQSLDVRNPGKAFARVTDYQGNIKMKKVDFSSRKELHPDAKFVKTNKNNVKEERDAVTNFKLLWARWFKKSDTQPSNLKEPVRKPRYDKREIGLWYD
jgi:hypothetical protein